MKYYVFTKNRFNQVLIFDTYEEASKWCKTATAWTDEEIKKNIKTPIFAGGLCSISE